MDNKLELTTRTVDLLGPADRFVTTTRLRSRLHRWHLVWRKYWWVVPVILAVVVGPVYLFSAADPPTYESHAKMWLAGKLDITEGHLYTEELGNFLGTQAELLASPVIQKGAMARLKARQTPTAPAGASPGNWLAQPFPNMLAAGVSKLLGRSSGATTNAESSCPFQVRVAESAKSSMLELRATGTEPQSTRAFLDCLMDEYLNFKRQSREQTSDRTVASVSGQVSQLASDLRTLQDRLYNFQKSNSVVVVQEQGSSAASYLGMINKQLAALRTELQFLQMVQPEQWMQLDGRVRSPDTPEGAGGDSTGRDMAANLVGPQSELFKANQQMQLLKAKRDELGRFLRPEHPKILKLNEDIATQERIVQISRDEAKKQLNHRREAVQTQIKNLESAFAEWDAKAVDASRKMADYERIRQDLQRVQAAYDKLLGLIQTVDVSKTLSQENVSILEPASIAVPNHRLLTNTLLATAAALTLGFGLLYLIGLFDDRFASLTELTDQLAEEVIGQIPDIALRKPRGELGAELPERQRFEFLESFRNLRASVLFMNNGRAKPKTIIVTSSVPQEGKSTVALYLAATMAMGNARVLLVDADLRRAALHQHFSLPQAPGLAEVLEANAVGEPAIRQTTLVNLMLLAAGEATRDPGELVLSAEWHRFLREAYRHFDYIFIDTPPLLATHDAAVLAPTVDGVLFVVRASYTSARMAREALQALHQRRVPVLGLILNRARSSQYECHYYSRYKDDYGWRPERAKASAELVANSANNGAG